MNNRTNNIVFSLLISLVLTCSLFNAGKVSASQTNEYANLIVFKDVAPQHWAYGAIEQSVMEGIVEGYEDQTFRPNQYVSAVEFITLFYRTYQTEYELPESNASNWKIPYEQLAKQFDWDIDAQQSTLNRGEVARFIYSTLKSESTTEPKAIAFMLNQQFSNGLTSATVDGYGANEFLTRAQAVTFLQNIKAKAPLISAYSEIEGDPSTNEEQLELYHEAKLRGVQLGETIASVKKKLGEPNRVFKTEDFTYYTYNADYTQYALYMIKNDLVQGMYSNAKHAWSTSTLANIGEVAKDDPEPRSIIIKYYYDEHEQNAVEGMLLATSYDFIPALANSKEEGIEVGMQNLDMTNAFRAKYNLASLSWDEKLASTAYNYSLYMYTNNHFDHNSIEGLSPFDRMQNDGISYRSAGENIAMGYRNAMAVTNGWINSLGHRQNLLNDSFQYIGVGVHYNYYTQNFIGH